VDADRITWLGHSTVLLELGGARLLTDPVLRTRVGPLRRQVPPPAAPGRLDGVLVSHVHFDHLDVPSLRGLDPTAPLVVPRGAGRAVRRLRRDLHELEPGDELALGSACVRAVPAMHDGHRWPLGPSAATLGYVARGGAPRPEAPAPQPERPGPPAEAPDAADAAHTHSVYFAGDTELFPGMGQLADRLDAALLPVWGWGPGLGPGHMDPEQAARALGLLRPALAVPIHWGTFLPVGLVRGRSHLLREPPRRFAALAAAAAPEVRVAVLEPGGSVALT
jgi:L-ascorbate metabolism protein UlaG (beta-lactamase superfamily)